MTPAEIENQRRIKMLELRSDLRDHLHGVIAHPRARELMASFVDGSPTARAFVMGVAPRPSMVELFDEVRATEDGRSLWGVLQAHEADGQSRIVSDRAAKIAEIERIQNPAARIAAARKAGLA